MKGFRDFIRIILTFFTLRLCHAQSCWRNTTCSGPADPAFPGEWQSNIYAPSSRLVSPKTVLALDGDEVATWPNIPTFKGNSSLFVFDFGIEVGGIVHLDYISSGGPGAIGLAFTEAKDWVGEWSDGSNGAFLGPDSSDGAIYANFTTAGNHSYVMPDLSLRGGFRYLTLFLIINGTGSVSITDIKLEIGFQPTWANLQAYQGYFHSNDELLNRIWYSGAYTLQTNAVPVKTGRQIPTIKHGWANNGTLGKGDTIIVDGAKRDRAVWPGDMGVAVPSTFVSIGDLTSVKNALQVMYDYQNADGSFPEAGPPLLQQNSDTYHMWTMIGTYNYLLYTNDLTFLQHNWARYQSAMSYIYGKVTYSSGLLDQTGLRDWARWQTGYNNSEAQMILYHTLVTGSDIAQWAEDSTNLTGLWASRASSLQSAINTWCYDDAYGAFKDNATATSLHPQDANSLSILFGVVNATSSRASSISANLVKNWSPIGPVSPELPGNISPFITSFEIQAHLAIGQTQRALDLIRSSWGWYLNNPNGTESTVVEGFLQNGTFGYRSSRGYGYQASYTSHSHGWSSGPTSALTTYVLGLSVTGPAGSSWRLAPQFGDLTAVQAGFSTSLGTFEASWTRSDTSYALNYTVPEGTTGELLLPTLAAKPAPLIQLDGRSLKSGDGAAVVQGHIVALKATGGSHTIVVS